MPHRNLVWLFASFVIAKSSLAAVIAAGSLQTCTNNGTGALDCTNKLVVTLTLENNKLHATDSLYFNLACVDSPTGACPCPCYYLTDPGCRCRDLRRAVAIAVTKTPVYAIYPLSQPHTFNGRPYEAYITTGVGGTESKCKDGEADLQPTCGWAKVPDQNGVLQDVYDSQGFCCKCQPFNTSPIIRGYRSCPFLPPPTGELPGSAHCLRYDNYWWYRGYVIGQYQLDFDIQVIINTTTTIDSRSEDHTSSGHEDVYQNFSEPGSSPSSTNQADAAPFQTLPSVEILSLSPSRTLMVSEDRTVAARLLGDLASYRPPKVLDGHWLMIPLQPGLDPNEVFSANLDMWVVLPPHMVSKTGECDRVGVGYTAFRNQANACGRPIGSCLSQQIYDLEREDQLRIQQGEEPLYNITAFGGGRENQRQVTAAANGGGLSLRLPIKGAQTSLVTLEVRADDVQLVVNKASGHIISTEICTFDRVFCGGFQAIAARGFLRLTVQNTGPVDAEFRASVLGCSSGVLPVLEEFSTIRSGDQHTFEFALTMENDQAGNRTCTVVLTDAVGDLADSNQVYFYTNATTYEPPPDQSDLENRPDQPGNPPVYTTCARKCPNIFNVACLVLNGCWKRLMQGLSAAAGIAIAATVTWMAIRSGLLKAWFKLCCGRMRKPRKERRREPSKQAEGERTPTAKERTSKSKHQETSSDHAAIVAAAMYLKQMQHLAAAGPWPSSLPTGASPQQHNGSEIMAYDHPENTAREIPLRQLYGRMQQGHPSIALAPEQASTRAHAIPNAGITTAARPSKRNLHAPYHVASSSTDIAKNNGAVALLNGSVVSSEQRAELESI
jgi:hypothetical protein